MSSRSGVSAVVVAAPEAWRAEVLAKAALIAGPRAGLDLLERAGVTAWMVDDGGELIRSGPGVAGDVTGEDAAPGFERTLLGTVAGP